MTSLVQTPQDDSPGHGLLGLGIQDLPPDGPTPVQPAGGGAGGPGGAALRHASAPTVAEVFAYQNPSICQAPAVS